MSSVVNFEVLYSIFTTEQQGDFQRCTEKTLNMQHTLNWYEIKNIDQVDSPALIIYKERIVENIRILKTMIDDTQRLRPHVKTHKTKQVVLLMLEAGINKFKCATIAEAEMLALSGAPDVLVAYQPVGPKIYRLIDLIKTYPSTRFSCLVDNIDTASSIARPAADAALQLEVFIDLNTGMNRTGIEPGYAFQLYKSCSSLKGIIPVGLHSYDGQIKDANIDKRTEICNLAFAKIDDLRKCILESGFKDPIIVAGGTPTFPIHAKRKDVECSPGTFVFWDKGYETLYPEQKFLPAAVVISRITSIPSENQLCLDLGHKAISAENDLQSRVHFLNAKQFRFIGHSEEHLVVESEPGHSFKIGDIFYGQPIHVCPTIALYDEAQVVEDNTITGQWNITARRRKINY